MSMVRFVGVVLALVVACMVAPTALAQDARDCENYRSQAAAQDVYAADPSDPYDLDRNKNGIACEALPGGFLEDELHVVGLTAALVGSTAGSTPRMLPDTGATDSMIGLALGVGVVMVGLGVSVRTSVRRRQV